MVRLCPNLSMVVIDPLQFCVAEQGWLNQVAPQGSHGDMFEAQPLLVAELVGGVDLTAHYNIYQMSIRING